jgi:hypothetical protein
MLGRMEITRRLYEPGQHEAKNREKKLLVLSEMLLNDAKEYRSGPVNSNIVNIAMSWLSISEPHSVQQTPNQNHSCAQSSIPSRARLHRSPTPRKSMLGTNRLRISSIDCMSVPGRDSSEDHAPRLLVPLFSCRSALHRTVGSTPAASWCWM